MLELKFYREENHTMDNKGNVESRVPRWLPRFPVPLAEATFNLHLSVNRIWEGNGCHSCDGRGEGLPQL